MLPNVPRTATGTPLRTLLVLLAGLALLPAVLSGVFGAAPAAAAAPPAAASPATASPAGASPAARAASVTTRAQAASLRRRILRVAESKLGYTERGNYCTEFGPCEVWCALFATWVWERAGVPIPHYAFVGYVWDWAAEYTSVLIGPGGNPQPGDTVMFGTGPRTVKTAPHMGIVEAVYPKYLVTIEGDVMHGVRRVVVPRRHPQAAGEPGPIWGYAEPVAREAVPAAVTDPALASAYGTIPIRPTGKLGPGDRRLLKTLRGLRAFQHMPFRGSGYRIVWTGVDDRGRVEVTVTTKQVLSKAEADWTAFLRRFGGTASAYAVTYEAAPNPPVSVYGMAPAVRGRNS